jgi:membrane-associated protein
VDTYGAGPWIYGALFAIIFCETGLVVTPFLPGDSLLFLVGALAAERVLNPVWAVLILISAALLGDNVNYQIGRFVGPKVLTGRQRFLKKEYLDRTHRFFETYGGKTIIIARFVPIVRTFAPFVAGVGSMTYWRFLGFCISGAMLWVGLLMTGGYVFGGFDFVKNHFGVVEVAIIIISLLPMAVEYLRHRKTMPPIPAPVAEDLP